MRVGDVDGAKLGDADATKFGEMGAVAVTGSKFGEEEDIIVEFLYWEKSGRVSGGSTNESILFDVEVAKSALKSGEVEPKLLCFDSGTKVLGHTASALSPTKS